MRPRGVRKSFMARENIIILHGQVNATPKIYLSKSGEPQKAIFALKVMRRPFYAGNGQIVGGKIYVDYPIVVTTDQEMIKTIADPVEGLAEGDMADVFGVLTTSKVRKSSICSQGHKNVAFGDFVYITPLYICQRERARNADEGLILLRKRSEVSNVLVAIGTLCRDPETYTTPGEKNITQYQIALNRKFHIHADSDSERTDYPWVKSFGKQATEDAMRLRTNSTVFIKGALQTRKIQRTTVCETCGEEYEWEETVSEIFPYSTEYLMNCLFPERGEPEADDVDDVNETGEAGGEAEDQGKS
jgi:hypothetical protein